MRSAVRFHLPPELEAAAPPEARGLRRDHVRLLLVDRATGSVAHHRFHELPQLLEPGDLLVVNDSRTLPASLLGHTAAGTPLEVRLAAREERGPGRAREEEANGDPGAVADQGTVSDPAPPPDGAGAARPGGLARPSAVDGPAERWLALPLGVPADGGDPALVPTDARPPAPELEPGERLRFAGGLTATVLGPHEEAAPLVWLAFDAGGERLAEALHRAGRPVRYAYVPRPWPLHHYQTLFAAGPGSAEMASAGRPFTLQTLGDLRGRGVGLATISLHAGLSTYGDPATDRRFVPAEPYLVPQATAAAVAASRTAGGRVVAVGTTVVRALETAAAGGRVRAGAGVTRLRIGPEHRLQAVDGLLTGLHEPEASHLDLLAAFVDRPALDRAYGAALAAGYLWHEFGDVCLLLPVPS